MIRAFDVAVYLPPTPCQALGRWLKTSEPVESKTPPPKKVCAIDFSQKAAPPLAKIKGGKAKKSEDALLELAKGFVPLPTRKQQLKDAVYGLSRRRFMLSRRQVGARR
eukprot:9498922-Pyramimonas_sp.AAC.1